MNIWTIVTGVVVAVATLVSSIVLVAKAKPEARKLGADSTAALLSATTATGAELAGQVAELQGETRKLWQAQREQEERVTAHLRWDAKVVDTLRELGGEISDPPPLYPEGV